MQAPQLSWIYFINIRTAPKTIRITNHEIIMFIVKKPDKMESYKGVAANLMNNAMN